jgi:hypothetical protein
LFLIEDHLNQIFNDDSDINFRHDNIFPLCKIDKGWVLMGERRVSQLCDFPEESIPTIINQEGASTKEFHLTCIRLFNKRRIRWSGFKLGHDFQIEIFIL